MLGGFVLSTFGDGIWRAIFAVNLPLGLLSIYLLQTRVPADTATERRSLDLGGGVLATLAFGALAYGLTSMSAEGGGHMSGPSIVAGLVLLVAFIAFERWQREPMIDLSLFRIRAFAGVNVATFFLYFALSANLFYLPMLLIAGWGLSTAEVGFIFLPLSASIALLSGPVGQLSDRIGPRFPIACGSLIVAFAFAGLALLTHAGIHHFWTGTFPLMALMGLGMALVVSPLSTAIMTAVEDKDTGAASGINNAVSRIAGLIAVAAMGSLAAWVYSTMLDTSARPGIPGFGEPVSTGLPPELEATRLAASDAAFSAISLTTAVLCLLAAIIAWMTVSGQALPWPRRTDESSADSSRR